MSTLIAFYKSDGRCIGRCDAKCYDATEPGCTCICGGANHGAGRSQAVQNTKTAAVAWAKESGADFVDIGDPVAQGSLFDD